MRIILTHINVYVYIYINIVYIYIYKLSRGLQASGSGFRLQGASTLGRGLHEIRSPTEQSRGFCVIMIQSYQQSIFYPTVPQVTWNLYEGLVYTTVLFTKGLYGVPCKFGGG